MPYSKTRILIAAFAFMLFGLLVLPACSDGAQDASESAQAETSEEYKKILEERVAAEEASKEAQQEAAIKADEQKAVEENVDEEALKAEREAAEAAEEAAQEEARLAAEQVAEQEAVAQSTSADALRSELGIAEDYRDSFVHGEKGAEFQKYIMLHDTEGSGDPYSVVSSWDASGNCVAAHFVVGKDGTVVQCVPMDKIAHHAGFGDAGHNAQYGVTDESRDDRVGTTPIGDWAPDYGMNSYSIGIEMVHVGGEGYYPEEQLAAVDKLIAYIDAYYGGNGGTIVDHKAWRSGNSDTSPEFATYLANYQDHRTHL